MSDLNKFVSYHSADESTRSHVDHRVCIRHKFGIASCSSPVVFDLKFVITVVNKLCLSKPYRKVRKEAQTLQRDRATLRAIVFFRMLKT